MDFSPFSSPFYSAAGTQGSALTFTDRGRGSGDAASAASVRVTAQKPSSGRCYVPYCTGTFPSLLQGGRRRAEWRRAVGKRGMGVLEEEGMEMGQRGGPFSWL